MKKISLILLILSVSAILYFALSNNHKYTNAAKEEVEFSNIVHPETEQAVSLKVERPLNNKQAEVVGETYHSKKSTVENNLVTNDIENNGVFKIKNLVSDKGNLKASGVVKVINDTQKVTAMLDELLYLESEIAQSNTMRFEQVFYSNKHVASGEIVMNRIGCSESMCIATLYLHDVTKVEEFTKSLQVSGESSIRSLFVGRDSNGINLIFPSKSNTGMIKIN